MKSRAWHQPLEFGVGEPFVRLVEDAEPEAMVPEIARRLARRTSEDDFYLAGARAAVRSTRYDGLGSGHAPHGLFALRSHRELGTRLPPDLQPYPLVGALRRIHAEIRDPAFGPTRLLHFTPVAYGTREEIRDAYLDAVLRGDTDLADHIFAWLFENLPQEEIADLLWTGGLEKVGLGSLKLTGALETYQLAQVLGWEHGAILLRAPVRHQSFRLVGENPFFVCRDRIASDGLHEKARRRLPGERGRGEDDPGGIWETALRWSGASPEGRTLLATRCLGGDWTLEDYWESLSLGVSILFLGATASGVPAARAARMVVAAHGMRGMIRLGNLSQKLLASLLAGRSPDFNGSGPEWVDAGVRVLEQALTASKVSLDELGEALAGWRADSAIAAIASSSADLPGLATAIPIVDHRLAILHGVEGLGPLVHLGQCEAFQAARSPHRWVHLACSSWLCAIWPERGLIEDPTLADLADRRRKDLARMRKKR